MTDLETDLTAIGDWEHAKDRGQLVRSWLEELATDGAYALLDKSKSLRDRQLPRGGHCLAG